jgi:hypothetical protein
MAAPLAGGSGRSRNQKMVLGYPMLYSTSRRPALGLGETADYQIVVQGCLDDHWADWFADYTVTVDDDRQITTISGSVRDQAALHGLLRQIGDLGLPLILVELL